jgi:hypothetical protein
MNLTAINNIACILTIAIEQSFESMVLKVWFYESSFLQNHKCNRNKSLVVAIRLTCTDWMILVLSQIPLFSLPFASCC